LAGALFFDGKLCQNIELFWFGMQDVGILQIFCSQAVIQRTIVDSPAVLEAALLERIAVCAHTTSLQKK
jgi:hypothetical protein